MKHWLLFIFMPFLLHAEIFWQADLQKPFMLTIKLSPQHLTLSDSLHLQVEIHYPSSYQIDTEELIHQLLWSANPLIPQWTLLESHLSSNQEEKVKIQYLDLTLSPLMTGSLQLSFLIFSFSSEQSNSPLEVSTPIFSFDIAQPSIITNLANAPMIPLEPQFPLDLTQANRQLFIDNPEVMEKTKLLIREKLRSHSFPWITLTLLLGLGGVGWVLYLTRDNWFKHSKQKTPSLSAKQQIDEALQTLQNQSFDQDQISLYYNQISSTLHKVIQIQLGWNAQKMTSTELIQGMRKHRLFSTDQIEEAMMLLTEIDQVKFAGKKPLIIEAQKFSQQTQQFIKKFISQ